jgi:hypothetical protein
MPFHCKIINTPWYSYRTQKNRVPFRKLHRSLVVHVFLLPILRYDLEYDQPRIFNMSNLPCFVNSLMYPDFYAIFWKVHDSSEFCKNIMGCLLSYSEKACSVIPHTLQITTSYPEIQYLYVMLQDLHKKLKYK